MRSIVDFRADGPTRGCLDPPVGPDGEIVRARPAAPCPLNVLRRNRSVHEVADLLCVSERTVWRWLEGASIPAPMLLLIQLVAERRGGGK